MRVYNMQIINYLLTLPTLLGLVGWVLLSACYRLQFTLTAGNQQCITVYAAVSIGVVVRVFMAVNWFYLRHTTGGILQGIRLSAPAAICL